MTRRAFLLLALSPGLRADIADEAWEVIATMAAALTASDAAEFLSAIDPALPGFPRLRANVTALVGAADIQTAIDAVENEGDSQIRTVTTDWLMLLKQKNSISPSIRRHEHLTCKMEKRGKKWVVVSLQPQSLFDAPHF